MEETVTIGIAFRGHRDSVPPAPLKPAPTHAFSEANRPLPFFTLLLPAVSVRKFQMSDKCGAPPWGSPTFGGSPFPIRTSRLCGLGYWAVCHGHRYTNRSAASRMRPLCTVRAFGLPGAKGCRYRSIRENDPDTQNF